MATKLAAVDGTKTRKARVSKPKRIAVTFDSVDGKLVVRKVYHDMIAFADDLTNDPTNIPLFAKIDL